MRKPTSITELPPSPRDEQRSRVINYAITMGIRTICFVLAVVLALNGIVWWWIPALGAIVLPYFAVIAANTVDHRRSNMVVARPGALERLPAAIPPKSPKDPREDAA